MISFENIDNYMFNIIIGEFLTYDEIKLFGKNYMYSYYKPNIDWNCEPNYFDKFKSSQKVILYQDPIVFLSKKLNFSWLKKWKLGIKQFYCQNDDGCKQACDFSNLSIKTFWIESKRNIIKFSNDVEEIIYLNENILDISKLKDLKNLKKFKIYNCKFSVYEKFYSDILFDKVIITNCNIDRKNSIDIFVDINSLTNITFNYCNESLFYKKMLEIKNDKLCNVKHIILDHVDFNSICLFFTCFTKLEKFEIIFSNYNRDILKHIILYNTNLSSLWIGSIENRNEIPLSLQSRKEILNYFN
jgi:hypothetical protein